MVELNGNIELLGKGKKKKKPVYRKAGGFNSGINRKGKGYNSGKNKVRDAGGFQTTDPSLLQKFYKLNEDTFLNNPTEFVKQQGKKIFNTNKEIFYEGPQRVGKKIYDTQQKIVKGITETGQEIYEDAGEIIDKGIDEANKFADKTTEKMGDIWSTITDFFDKYKWWVIGGIGGLLVIYLITSTKAGTAVYRSYFPAPKTTRRRR